MGLTLLGLVVLVVAIAVGLVVLCIGEPGWTVYVVLLSALVAGVMTVASVPRTLGETLIAEEGLVFYVWFFIWWLGVPIWIFGTLLTLALSRYREYAADRGSALLTGRPAALMSALVKLDDRGAGIPADDLRALARVEALWVVPNGRRPRFSLFADHPPLEKRLARLAEMARVMGSAVGP